MTLDGTNTWLVGEPAGGPVVGGRSRARWITAHLDAIVGAAPGGIGAVLLTHRHLDHAESAAELAPAGRAAAYARRTRPCAWVRTGSTTATGGRRPG